MSAWRLGKQAIRDFSDDGAALKAAGVAFYALLALVPAFALMLAGASFVVGSTAAQPLVVAKLAALLGAPAAEAIARTFELLGPGSSAGLSLASGAISAYGATRAIAHVQGAVNEIWRAHALGQKTPRGLRAVLKRHLLAVVILLGLTAILLASTLVEVALNISWRSGSSAMVRWPVWTLQAFASLAALTGLHGVAYKVLPEPRVRWHDVWPAAFTASLLFIATKAALCFYIGHAALQSASAALGSVLALMLWVDGYTMLFFLGVELTQVLSNRPRDRSPPDAARGLAATPVVQGADS